jgi:hypothetical protein
MEGSMQNTTEVMGFIGAGLAGAAYVPQISHLVRAHCSAGISRPAFELWLLASLLTTVHAVAIGAGVFVVLGTVQVVATAVIMRYARRYQDTPCPTHPAQMIPDRTGTMPLSARSVPPSGDPLAC